MEFLKTIFGFLILEIFSFGLISLIMKGLDIDLNKKTATIALVISTLIIVFILFSE